MHHFIVERLPKEILTFNHDLSTQGDDHPVESSLKILEGPVIKVFCMEPYTLLRHIWRVLDWTDQPIRSSSRLSSDTNKVPFTEDSKSKGPYVTVVKPEVVRTLNLVSLFSFLRYQVEKEK